MTCKLSIAHLLVFVLLFNPIFSASFVSFLRPNRRPRLDRVIVETPGTFDSDNSLFLTPEEARILEGTFDNQLIFEDIDIDSIILGLETGDLSFPGAYNMFGNMAEYSNLPNFNVSNSVLFNSSIGGLSDDNPVLASEMSIAIASDCLNSNENGKFVSEEDQSLLTELQYADPFISTHLPRLTAIQEEILTVEASKYRSKRGRRFFKWFK